MTNEQFNEIQGRLVNIETWIWQQREAHIALLVEMGASLSLQQSVLSSLPILIAQRHMSEQEALALLNEMTSQHLQQTNERLDQIRKEISATEPPVV